MKTLTLWQPWASLIALGAKTIETRGWSTNYRGPLAIHAAKRRVASENHHLGEWHYQAAASCLWRRSEARWRSIYQIPFGAIVATCEMVDVVPIVDAGDTVDWARPYVAWWTGAPHDSPDGSLHIWEEDEATSNITGQAPYGDFAPGRFAWLLDNITPLPEPIPTTGRQGLWEWTE